MQEWDGQTYIAHRREDGAEQPLLAHLLGAAERARRFAEDFGAGKLAGDIAMCHDTGKYSARFQKRIRGANVKVDHATPGGQLLWKQNDRSKLGLMAAYCVMGHHSGLPDGGSPNNPEERTLNERLCRQTEDCSAYAGELILPRLEPPPIQLRDGFGASFFVRMLFSALVDADFLDTEAFMDAKPRGGTAELPALRDRLNAYVDPFVHPKEEVSELNARRTALLRNCLSAAEEEAGLFTLTAPTGSGKTIASLAFALNHAAKWGKRRVIYVVPYNTIIEQNAAVFEGILGAENVLQHHSGVQYDDQDDAYDEEVARKRLATENWDYPVVVTSSVQFFQSLFGSRTSRCRKLHNIAGSVIIFDEAQMIPVPHLIPCVRAIRELVERCGCTAVLATATQSALEGIFNPPQGRLSPLELREITANPRELYTAMRRTEIQAIPDQLTDDALAERLGGHGQVLCIVNTRKAAQSLFEKLGKTQPAGTFHLSTLMTPAHRGWVLREIRERLGDGLPCRVVSTSLVEAGVDLDFPAVYREEAGLDSVVQAAGRCNREGKRPAAQSIVYVFTSADHKPLRMIAQNVSAAQTAMRSTPDAASLDAIKEYFQQLFYIKGDEALDVGKVVSKFDDGLRAFSFPFREIADAFRLIDQDTRVVYVLDDTKAPERRARGEKELTGEEIAAEKAALKERLLHGGPGGHGERSRALFRALGPYSLSLYRDHMKALLDIGAAERVDEEIFLLNPVYYDEHTGVNLSPEGGEGIFMKERM